MSSHRRLRSLIAASALAAAAVLAIGGPAGAKPGTGCAPGTDIGPIAFDDAIRLPRIVTGLAAGVYTVEELAAGWAAFELNGDGLACLKAVSNLRGNSTKHWEAFYLASDNDHPSA